MPAAEPGAEAGRGAVRSVLDAAVVALLVVCLGMAAGSLVLGRDADGLDAGYTTLDPAEPVRLVVPALGIRAPVVPVEVSTSRVLDPPRDPQQVGWWSQSAEPGMRAGQTVITGHTVHTGGGAMDAVHSLRRGQRIDVETGNGTMRYSVTRVRTLTKDTLAENAVALFGQSGGDGRLVLVSCDDWDGTAYESNVIVLATPLGRPEV